MTKFASLLAAALLASTLPTVAATTIETLPSGVRVEHLVTGNGATPGPTSRVTVHYRGTLRDGSEFDSSYKRNQPATFGLHQVIPCWTQGVQTMKVGGTAKLSCPAATAYGSRNLPGIPAGSDLTFEVQLLEIK